MIVQAADIFPRNIKHYFVSFTTLAEYTLLIWFIWLNIKNPTIKKLALFISVMFIIFIIIYSATVPIKTIDNVPIGVETILILSFSFYFLYEKMNDPNIVLIYNDYRFWIVLGMIIYLAGSFFIYIFSDQLQRKDFEKYLMLPYVFYTMKNILFAVGIFLHARQIPKTNNSPLKKTVPFLDVT